MNDSVTFRWSRPLGRGPVAAVALLCAAWSLTSSARAAVRVVTTTPTLAAIAREIGGDRVTVQSIARPEEDPHFVKPKPSFMVDLRRADLFVAVGMGLEVGWAPPLLRGARNGRIQQGGRGHVDGSVGIVPLEVPAIVSRTEGDVHPQGNPHYWLDPANGAVIARNVAEGLARVDPAGAPGYADRLAAFEGRLAAALREWDAALSGVTGTELVAYHRTWPYLARAFGLSFVAELEPKPGIPPSPRHVAELTELMERRDLSVIVRSQYEPARAPQRLAQRVGARVLVLPTEPAEGETYVDFVGRIVASLARELSG